MSKRYFLISYAHKRRYNDIGFGSHTVSLSGGPLNTEAVSHIRNAVCLETAVPADSLVILAITELEESDSGHGIVETPEENARLRQLVADAHDTNAHMRARIDTIRQMHRPTTIEGRRDLVCTGKHGVWTHWPCAEARALGATEGDE